MNMNIFVLLIILTINVNYINANAGPLIINTKAGQIKGAINNDGSARVWRGIPYAEPPVNKLRYSSPVPKQSWSGIKDTTTNSPACPQNCVLPDHACSASYDEDCLYINVFAPLSQPVKPRPVMVWIHGGDYIEGTAMCSMYDASYITNSSDTIVVTMNYRLGLFGFLYSDKMKLEGNYAIEDQQLVLKWVQENIVQFGGDPNAVTIFGQSAGAISVAIHMYSPASKNLFHRAIMMSVPFSLHFRSPSDWDEVSNALSDAVKCPRNNVECLRNVTWQEMTTIQKKIRTDVLLDWRGLLQLFLPFSPTTPTKLVPHKLMDAFINGATMDIPFIMGDTKNEAVLFVYQAFGKPLNWLEYDIFADLIFSGKYGSKIVEKYKAQNPNDARSAMANAGTDSLFQCANRNTTMNWMKSKKNKPFLYFFTHVPLEHEAWGNATYCYDVVCHGSDVPFAFHSISLYKNVTEGEKILSTQMVNYFTSFAETGVPSSKDDPIWPSYDVDNKYSMNFDTGKLVIDKAYDNTNCTWWDENIGYYWP